MNTYYTTRDFEFLRNRPVVLESEALADICIRDKQIEELERENEQLKSSMEGEKR